MSVLTEEQEEYLKNHNSAVLATGRNDGSPQISQIAYAWNGAEVVISIKSYTAKWKNAQRQSRVALLVADGHKQLIIYGQAICIDSDPERAQATVDVFRVITGNTGFAADEDFISMLNEQQRTIFKITPQKALMND